MGLDVIKKLESTIADLSYVLFVIRKEFELMDQRIDDKNIKMKLSQVMSAMQDSNNEVIKLYHGIKTHEKEMQTEWYKDKSSVEVLQKEVDNLGKSIDVLLKGNKAFLNYIQ